MRGRQLCYAQWHLVIFKDYMVGVHRKLKEIGWRQVYTKDDLALPTSVFGSSVDWAYASPNWPTSLSIRKPHVIDVIHAADESWASCSDASGLKLSLSDHNPVMMDIRIS
jgi:hypothetical protein